MVRLYINYMILTTWYTLIYIWIQKEKIMKFKLRSKSRNKQKIATHHFEYFQTAFGAEHLFWQEAMWKIMWVSKIHSLPFLDLIESWKNIMIHMVILQRCKWIFLKHLIKPWSSSPKTSCLWALTLWSFWWVILETACSKPK